MGLLIHWRPASGPPTSADLSPAQVASGFASLGAAGPEVFIFAQGNDALSIVLANGLTDKADPSAQRGTLSGHLSVQYGGATQLQPSPVTLHDGCWQAFRFGKADSPAYAPPSWWASWAHRSLDACTEADRVAVLHRLGALPLAFKETGATDAAGSARVCQHRWEGAIDTAEPLYRPHVRNAALDWTDLQGNRPALYYHADGSLVRRPDFWVDEHGARKGSNGKWARPSSSPWQLEDLEHLAPDRHATAAFAFNDPVAKLYMRAYLNAMLSRPGIATVKPPEQSRAVGYTLDLLALAALAYPDDVDIVDAALRVVEGLRLSMGFGLGGVPYMALRPLTALHASHVSVTLWDLKNAAPLYGVTVRPEWDAMTPAAILKEWPKSAADKMRWWLQGADIWGVAILGRGLAAISRVPAIALKIPDLSQLIRHAAGFILRAGKATSIGQDGLPFTPIHVVDSAAPRSGRAHPCNAENGGTKRWIVPAGLDMLPSLGPVQAADMQGLCREIWEDDDTFKLSGKTADSIRIGLPAIARFGGR